MDKLKTVATLYDRKSGKSYTPKLDIPWLGWVAVKFVIYGGIGMNTEIIFTDIVRLLHQVPFLKGLINSFAGMSFPAGIPDQMLFPSQYMFAMSSFWMIFVYGTGFYLIENLWKFFHSLKGKKIGFITVKKGIPWYIRGFFYTWIVILVELIYGLLYHYLLFKPDYLWAYNDAWNILRTTTLSIFPYWFLASLAAEVITRKLSETDLETAFRTNHDDRREQVNVLNTAGHDVTADPAAGAPGQS